MLERSSFIYFEWEGDCIASTLTNSAGDTWNLNLKVSPVAEW